MEEGQNLPAKNFRDLRVWQAAFELTLQIYKITSKFPAMENYGLSNQMNRAAISVCSNIAEGFGRRSRKEKDYFYSNANGSLTELENQLLIASGVGYINNTAQDNAMNMCETAHRQLAASQKKNRTPPNSHSQLSYSIFQNP